MTAYPEETIYSLLRRPDTAPTSRWTWALLTWVGALAWIGTVAFLGEYLPNDVSRFLAALLPPDRSYWGAVLSLAATAAWLWGRGSPSQAKATLVVMAFLLGNLLYRAAVPLLPHDFDVPFRSGGDLLGFVSIRAAWGVCLTLAMGLVWLAARLPRSDLALGPGQISRPGRESSLTRPPQPWARMLWTGYGGFILVALVALQASVAFRPIVSGALWAGLPAVFAAALVNSLAEEYIFRGMMMPALIKIGGVGAGLWAQGALFGLMHWGLGVGVLGALPVSLGIGFGSVFWGKAALDTGGMLWVVIAHMMIDVAVMAAYFV